MGMPWRQSVLFLFWLCLAAASTGPALADEPAVLPGEQAALAIPQTEDAADQPEETSEPAETADPQEPLEATDDGEVLTFSPDPDFLFDSHPRSAGSTGSSTHCRRCPDFCRYSSFDVLFLQRDNGTNGNTLAENAQSAPLLTTRDLQPATAAGIRLFYGKIGPNQVGWELGYTGVYGMFGEARTEGVGGVEIPGGLGQSVNGWATANAARPTYASSLNMFEANLFHHSSCRTGGAHSPFPWDRVHDPYCRTVNWMFGLRWAGLGETADLNVQTDPGEPYSSYSVTTSSQLFGPQIGLKERRQWKNWAVEGWAKTMLAGTFTSSYADAITSPLTPGVEYRPAREVNDAGVGFVADLNYSLTRRLGDHWWLRLGYNLIWVTGVALAPNQFDFTDTATSGTNLISGSSVFLHGANLGLEARW